MRKYWHVINIGIQNTLVYRVNFLFRAVFGLIPLMATIFLWRTIYAGKASGDAVAGYTLAQMTSYYLLGLRVHRRRTLVPPRHPAAGSRPGPAIHAVPVSDVFPGKHLPRPNDRSGDMAGAGRPSLLGGGRLRSGALRLEPWDSKICRRGRVKGRRAMV